MNFIHFFITYFLHLLFGALCICGFFAITRGSKEILPNGKEKRNGKIFKGWYFYWFREYGEKLVYYSEEQLDKLYLQINNSSATKLMPVKTTKVSVEIVGVINQTWKLEMEMRFNIKIIEKKHDGNTILHFAKAYPKYRFPEWVRDVMAGCITCHSSWLGSICFWVPVAISGWWDLRLTYGFTEYFVLALIGTWVAYCVSLAFITTALWRKYMP